MILLLAIVALAIGVFYGVLQLDVPGAWKFGLVFIEMVIVGRVLIKRYKLPSELGMILLKSRIGIELIEKMAKNKQAFHFMTDVGNILAYGLSSMVIMKRSNAASLLVGLVLLAFISVLVAPSAFLFLVQVIQIGATEKSIALLSDNPDLGLLAISAVLLFGGLAFFILFGIIFYGGTILYAVIESLFLGADSISQISPGGTFLLPGVNLPLVEGILALLAVIVVHEGCHSILTRIARVPLLSSGIVLFGIIPVGAFIEPDEEKLAKVNDLKQTRVIIAGPTANLIASVVFFIIFAGIALLINGSGMPEEGILAGVARFTYMTLGLTFALNFIVGAINLLPLPVFDGFRIFDINVKNKRIVNALMYVTLIFFVLNFLPWLFR
ncbi:hypothetical protein GF318_01675 [Candidatus Micrarchaeota archaeon]|nr:hypothetical protein [Candidatus Micrarchaeota archaeon]